MDNKENLFLTKHVAAVFITFFITSIAPAIDKGIAGTLTGKDIAFLINSGVVALLAGATKGLDKNVYTPKYLPGRDKEQALAAVYVEPTVVNTADTVAHITQNPVGTVVGQITKDPVANQVASIIDTVSNPINLLGKSSGGSTHVQNTTGMYIKALQKTWLKKHPVDSTTLDDNEKMALEPDDITYIVSYEEPVAQHIEIQAGRRTWFAFAEHVVLYKDSSPISFSTIFMPTQEQLSTIYGNTVTDTLYSDFVNCLQTFGINTPEDVCHFISQTAHESGGLQYTKEIGGYQYFTDNYEGRKDLGNLQKGDGAKYAGAGAICITGRANYTDFSHYMNDPEIVNQGMDYVSDKYFFSSAGFWWKNNDMSNYINNQKADVYSVSVAVNGGTNGMDDRVMYFNLAKKVLNV